VTKTVFALTFLDRLPKKKEKRL